MNNSSKNINIPVDEIVVIMGINDAEILVNFKFNDFMIELHFITFSENIKLIDNFIKEYQLSNDEHVGWCNTC